MTEVVIYTDGAARGNPGPAGAGAVLFDPAGKVVSEVCEYLGETTNNQAEYRALLLALKEARKLGALRATIYSDSELMVRQINGEYRVKDVNLKPLYLEAITILRQFGGYIVSHIVREKNKRADKLANLAIDGQML